MVNEKLIRDRLVEHGQNLFKGPPVFLDLSGDKAADALVQDLYESPHAFVLASIMDQQVRSERAWIIPLRLKQKLGSFSMPTLLRQSEADFQRLLSEPVSLHRFVDKMARFLVKAVRRIAMEYRSDASLIWRGTPSSATVVYRFLEFDGVGPKIASMAANILARHFKIEFSDYFSIDISADVHVRRVFGRLGLTSAGASVEQLIFRARGLHPEFPGLMDSPAWEIGRKWCKPGAPDCAGCYMNDLCRESGGSGCQG